MRIIAGQFRGRRLLPPATGATRPVTDRVKQSTFDILAPQLDGATVYDCFAGTGSMGLECLSRGASHVTFFEADRSAAQLLRQNIDALGVAGQSTVVTDDLFNWFAGIANSQGRDPQTDVIFLDPPYRFLRDRPDALQRLAKLFTLHHLRADGTVVFRHDAADALALPPLVAADVRTYGSMTVEFLRHLTPAPSNDPSS
jgi:16S rRNA (guanine966-N2)-methyltransferase